jgi:hypothetical protein
LELEKLRGDLGQHMAEIKGDIRLIAAQSSRTEQDLRDHADRLGKLDNRVAGLERRVWFSTGFAAALGTLGGWLSTYLAGRGH